MKTHSILAIVALSVFVVTAIGADADVSVKGAKCPITGKRAKDIDGSSTAYNGGKLFFCCAGCPEVFSKHQNHFAPKANAQLVTTGQLEQAACPITGRPLNQKQTLKVGGATVSFCCAGCKGKVAKLKGDAKLESVFGERAYVIAKFAAPKKKSR